MTEVQDDTGSESMDGIAAGGLAGWIIRWWKMHGLQARRRAQKRQMFIVESLILGPKQRMVLLKCGEEQFLIGTGGDGIQSVTRLGVPPAAGELAAVAGGLGRWG